MISRTIVALAALGSLAAAPVRLSGFSAVTFTDAPPLARNGALIERLFSPFAAVELAAKNDPQTLADFPIDPRAEKFGLYVPALRPPRGYGLLVWVSPVDGAGIPPSWKSVLDERGIIYVIAARSGNETSPLGRRVPLALTGFSNVVAAYPVDPDRVWIGGFSGGARIAQRMALAYPDLFAGAILDGSADALGATDIPLPPRDRYDRLADRSAFFFTTGLLDDYNRRDARRVMNSMRGFCIDRLESEVRPREGHELMTGRSLAKAFDYLDRPRGPTDAKSRQCRGALFATIDRTLARAATLKGDRARSALEAIDRQYGGLALPRSLELLRAQRAEAVR